MCYQGSQAGIFSNAGAATQTMLARLKAALASDNLPAPEDGGEEAVRIACAALLVEAAGMDENFDKAERDTILSLLSKRFDTSKEQAEELLASGEAEAGKATSLYRFTRKLNDFWNVDERAELLHLLWRVAYADGSIDPHEDMLIRRLAGLLHVSDRARAEARKRAANSSAPKEAP